MQQSSKLGKTQNKLKTPWLMVSIFASIALALTIYHSLLIPEPLAVYYIALIALLFTIAIIFVIFASSRNLNNLKHISKSCIFFAIYSLLLIWLAVNKTIPEYREIQNFQVKRIELIYWNAKKEAGGTRALALLYLHARPAVSRVEPNANHWGTKLMRVYLEDQIANGPEAHYKSGSYNLADDMYDLAEVAFIYSSRDIAHEWYQKAYEYGRKDALERYNEQMKFFR